LLSQFDLEEMVAKVKIARKTPEIGQKLSAVQQLSHPLVTLRLIYAILCTILVEEMFKT
jgi:hypothetical protein